MNLKRIAPIAAAALIAMGLWLAWFCKPERQVRRHTAVLLKAVERRNWEKVKGLMAEGYGDRWRHDKTAVAEALPQAFGQFLFLKIEHETNAAEAQDGAGHTITRVKMSGSGGPIAQYVMEKVNNLSEPFTFYWSQRSGWPWDWELTRVDHPSLDPGGMPRL